MKTKSMTIWMMVLVLCVSSSQVMAVMAWIQYNDGGTHDIATTINDDVWVDWQAPGMGTTVNLLDGGQILYSYNVQAFEDSQLNIFGGVIEYSLAAHNSSLVTISGGTVGNDLYAHDSSKVSISGGSIGNDLYLYGSSQVDVSGGSIGSYLRAYDSSQVTVSGGSAKKSANSMILQNVLPTTTPRPPSSGSTSLHVGCHAWSIALFVS